MKNIRKMLILPALVGWQEADRISLLTQNHSGLLLVEQGGLLQVPLMAVWRGPVCQGLQLLGALELRGANCTCQFHPLPGGQQRMESQSLPFPWDSRTLCPPHCLQLLGQDVWGASPLFSKAEEEAEQGMFWKQHLPLLLWDPPFPGGTESLEKGDS